jgi:L-threonylcarbamoyladenylate synthase
MSKGNCETLSVDPQSPDRDAISKAASRINRGRLVVFPTSTFYGLGAQAFDIDAVDRVFRLKRRNSEKPILILIASLTDLAPLVRSIPETAQRIIKAFWPGSVTLVFRAAEILPKNLTGQTGKIGIRVVNHPVASALVREVGSPVTGTSANISGEDGCASVGQLDRRIKANVDLVLDAGELGGGKGSTVVDVTVDPPRILREGLIRQEEITASLEE